MAHPQVVDGEDLQVWRAAANMLNKQSWTANKRWSCLRQTTAYCKRPACYEMLDIAVDIVGSCEYGTGSSGFIKGTDSLSIILAFHKGLYGINLQKYTKLHVRCKPHLSPLSLLTRISFYLCALLFVACCALRVLSKKNFLSIITSKLLQTLL
jgi:hypothetical protein